MIIGNGIRNGWRLTLILILINACVLHAQEKKIFSIRTITAGVTMTSLSDTVSLLKAVAFLKQAKMEFEANGYEVQTLRISTQPLHHYMKGITYDDTLPYLVAIDQLMQRSETILAIGPVIPPDYKGFEISDWAVRLIQATETINFSISIADQQSGILGNGVHHAALTIATIAENTPRGEGNFRFTASANCPPNIPFFPVAYHEGVNSFGIGVESPNILTSVFARGPEDKVRENLKLEMERVLKPIESIGMKLSKTKNWKYDGIDTSTAPGLGASIGEAIETLTGQPFGSASTLSACAMITDVLKSVEVKRCGYSGLMLPVIEDKVLAQRASEGRFSVQELLLYSSVSGTGLDVVPLPGETSITTIENILIDVAALSLKYTNKALSARLFLIPGKQAGEWVEFDNPYLTRCKIMSLE